MDASVAQKELKELKKKVKREREAIYFARHRKHGREQRMKFSAALKQQLQQKVQQAAIFNEINMSNNGIYPKSGLRSKQIFPTVANWISLEQCFFNLSAAAR